MKTTAQPRHLWPALFAAVLVVLAGCDTTTKLAEPSGAAPVETRSVGAKPAAAAGTAATASATPQSKVATVDLAAKGAGTGVAGASASGGAATAGTAMMAMPTQRVIYFDFDSYGIKDDFKPLIDNVAKVLAANRSRHLVVEGHTDERGGREYNLALGQKRAEAVVRSLTLLGAADKQLEAVSFGEERPAVQGSDEAAWAKNRRAELKDR
jgi:peptidoglycan-associated lipoprotein